MALDYGIKISESGQNVLSCADRYLTLKSNYSLLKVAFQGTTSASGTHEVTHSLGYVPQFLVYVDNASETEAMFTTYKQQSIFEVTQYGYASADTTKLYIISGGGTRTMYWYIFYEQA